MQSLQSLPDGRFPDGERFRGSDMEMQKSATLELPPMSHFSSHDEPGSGQVQMNPNMMDMRAWKSTVSIGGMSILSEGMCRM